MEEDQQIQSAGYTKTEILTKMQTGGPDSKSS